MPSRKGELWIGTSAGAVRYDFAKERFVHFDTSYKEGAEMDKLPISDFEEDKEGNIYTATASGIFRFDINKKNGKTSTTGFSPKDD
jgi:ligand-binding sensor domain-containing protein